MKDFEKWFDELISDQIWHDPASMHHKPETFRKIAHRVYMQEVANGLFRPMTECRKHVYNIICKTPGDAKKVDWVTKALKEIEQEKEKEWQPASPENVDKYVAQIQEIIKESPMMNYFPRVGYKQSIEEGGWLPPKQAPYPQTSEQEAYVRQRHLEYVKNNFEPRTGAKLPEWISEDEWNIQYDNNMI